MAKAQKNNATDKSNDIYNNASTQTQPVIDTANQQQQTAISRAGDNYNTANEGYKKFAETGGFSPSDETIFLNRATRGVSGTYDVLRQASDRRRAAAGGLGTGGEDVALARHAAQDVGAANTDAMASLKQQENANKFAGLAGQSHLFDANTGQVTAQGQQILQALGLRFSTQDDAIKALTELSKSPGTFDNILKVMNLATGHGASTY